MKARTYSYDVEDDDDLVVTNGNDSDDKDSDDKDSDNDNNSDDKDSDNDSDNYSKIVAQPKLGEFVEALFDHSGPTEMFVHVLKVYAIVVFLFYAYANFIHNK